MIPPLFRRVLRLLMPLLTTGAARAVTAPTGFTLTWNSAGVINASWTDRSSDETGFHITYRTSSAGQFSIYASVGANETTFTGFPTNWPCLGNFEWAVFAYNGSGNAASNIVAVVAPPRVTSANYASGNIGQNFSHTLTSACASPVWAAAPIPAGFTFNAATGTITGTRATAGVFTVNITLTAGGKTGIQTLKIRFFRPVPGLEAPLNGTPLSNRTLRRGAAAATVDLAAHFHDPDVTDASRLVFNVGTMDFLYYPTTTPATVANFKGYISRGDLANTLIHRKMTNFVIQGGGYKAESGTPSIPRQPPVVNEPEITNARGTVAMAKSADSPDSATSEFFVSLEDNALNLNNQNEGFTVFARVPAAGMAVADAINAYCDFSFGGVLSNCPVTTWPVCPVPKPATPAFSLNAVVKLISAGPVAPLSYAAQSSAPGVCAAAVNSAQLSLTPLAAGTATITVTATDLDGQSLQRTFSVTVEEHLADWLAAQNFPNAGDAAALANPDGDTAPNIMEFALLTNPQSATPVPAPLAGTTTVAAEKFLTLAFPVRKLTGGGFRYAVESHSALTGAWVEVWNSTQGFAQAQVVSAADQPDRTEVVIRDNTPITAGGGHFLRLRVTDIP